jgi:hypothetical protein
MPKEREEHFLNDLFPIVNGDPERERITQQRIAEPIEEFHDLALDLRWLSRNHRAGNGGKSELVD